MKALGKKPPQFDFSPTRKEMNILRRSKLNRNLLDRAIHFEKALLEAAEELKFVCRCKKYRGETMSLHVKCDACELAEKLRISAGVEE